MVNFAPVRWQISAVYALNCFKRESGEEGVFEKVFIIN